MTDIQIINNLIETYGEQIVLPPLVPISNRCLNLRAKYDFRITTPARFFRLGNM